MSTIPHWKRLGHCILRVGLLVAASSCAPAASNSCPTPPNCGSGTHQENCACVANSGSNPYAGRWSHLYVVVPANSAEDHGSFTVDANGAFAVPLGNGVLAGNISSAGGMTGSLNPNCSFSGSCPSSTTCSAVTSNPTSFNCAYAGGQGSEVSRVNLTR